MEAKQYGMEDVELDTRRRMEGSDKGGHTSRVKSRTQEGMADAAIAVAGLLGKLSWVWISRRIRILRGI